LLKRLIVHKDEAIKYLFNQSEIESLIIKHNKAHYKQAFESKGYTNSIYNKLLVESIRNKILKGELLEEDCDNNKVY